MAAVVNLNPGLDDEGLTQDVEGLNEGQQSCDENNGNGFIIDEEELNEKISKMTPTEAAKYCMANLDPEMAKPIQPDDEFANIQPKILWKDKWKYLPSYLLLPQPIYILPNGKHPRDKGVEGVDFVCSEYGLRKFCVEVFGWKGDQKYVEGMEEEEEQKEGRGRKRRKVNMATPSPVVKKVEGKVKAAAAAEKKKAKKKAVASNKATKEDKEEEEEPLVQSDDSDSDSDDDSSAESTAPEKTGANYLLGGKILWPATSSFPVPFKNSTNGTKMTLLTQVLPGDFGFDVGLQVWRLIIPAHRSTKLDKNQNGIWAHTITKPTVGKVVEVTIKVGKEEKKLVCGEGDTFVVPTGANYSVKNGGDREVEILVNASW
ncbi:hypothetical protein TrVE_jg12794 [Triparma verrucosa]|uniref:Uncharacterized protein n=1 Tax=Triparma verrucosa TaxID=1606542 RepID=A0A9W7F7B9_9STRA|nr:hypothetical protein TrVE_jg12794 [Triparma verrucosa]